MDYDMWKLATPPEYSERPHDRLLPALPATEPQWSRETQRADLRRRLAAHDSSTCVDETRGLTCGYLVAASIVLFLSTIADEVTP